MTVDKALEVWSAQALCDLGILLSLLSSVLHLSRSYVDRHLAGLMLRMTADLGRLAYLTLRDGTLVLAVVIGLFHLNLDLMADIKIGLPFVPLATVVLTAAMLVKLFGRTDAGERRRHLVGGLVTTGAFLNLLGFVLVMEGPGIEYGLAADSPLRVLVSWRSNANPRFTLICFSAALTLIALEVLVTVVAARLDAMSRDVPPLRAQDGLCDLRDPSPRPSRRAEPAGENPNP